MTNGLTRVGDVAALAARTDELVTTALVVAEAARAPTER